MIAIAIGEAQEPCGKAIKSVARVRDGDTEFNCRRANGIPESRWLERV